VEGELQKVLPSFLRRLGGASPQHRILRATLASEPKTEGGVYALTLSLQLPDRAVVVQKKDKDLHLLVHHSVSAMKKELQRSLARLRKDHLKRKRRASKESFFRFSEEVIASENEGAEGKPSKKNGTASSSDPVFARLKPLLGPLFNYAREQIRTAQLAGELGQGYLAPDDLVDQAMVSILDAGKTFLRDPEALEAKLFQKIDQLLAHEIAQQNPGAQSPLNLDEAASGHSTGHQDPEIEEREFYQPFQALRVEDVLIDETSPDPVNILSDIEEYGMILSHLSQFPRKARSAFFLNRFEGFDTYEVAMIQGRTEDEVHGDIQQCVQALKKGLGSKA
jgi:DNA-directed RNA polymerase specialized sigma24 family protein